jgi:hypothetical protein
MANKETGGFCGCALLILVINLLLGGFCFDYCFWAIFGKDIPWYGDMICGLFLGEFVLPLSVVLWILSFFLVLPLT